MITEAQEAPPASHSPPVTQTTARRPGDGRWSPDISLSTASSASESTRAMSSTSWNTSNLGLRSGADLAAAASAGVLVAPVITMIDRIIENASGRATLRASLANSFRTLLTRPHAFILTRPFFLIFTLYSGTYFTANTLDTVSSTLLNAPANTVTSGLPKFAATSSANLALCLYKDSQFTRLFAAPGATPRAIPLPTYALFTLRDCLTVFASFNVPPVLAPMLDERLRNASGAVAAQLRKHVDAASVAQFVAPAAVQIISTPMHLLGLDLYNRHDASWRQRAQKVRREWFAACLARMGRIVPAFGVGGVVNMRVRRSLLGRLEDKEPVVIKV